MKPHPDQHFGCISYAQHGDDFMLLNIFKKLGIKNPSYLDIGAHHPVIISNTALLYQMGCRGVNVEANPNLIDSFKKIRPKDVTVNVGIALESGTMPFFMYSATSGRNTLSLEETSKVPGMTVKEVTRVPVTTLKKLVDQYCKGIFPDLLTMDIEGLDFEVLSATDFSKNPPKVIVVEVRDHQVKDFIRMMSEKGFQSYCRMGENIFFVRKDLFHKVWDIDA